METIEEASNKPRWTEHRPVYTDNHLYADDDPVDPPASVRDVFVGCEHTPSVKPAWLSNVPKCERYWLPGADGKSLLYARIKRLKLKWKCAWPGRSSVAVARVVWFTVPPGLARAIEAANANKWFAHEGRVSRAPRGFEHCPDQDVAVIFRDRVYCINLVGGSLRERLWGIEPRDIWHAKWAPLPLHHPILAMIKPGDDCAVVVATEQRR